MLGCGRKIGDFDCCTIIKGDLAALAEGKHFLGFEIDPVHYKTASDAVANVRGNFKPERDNQEGMNFD